MTLPTYSNKAGVILSLILCAAPVAAHKLEHHQHKSAAHKPHSTTVTQQKQWSIASGAELIQQYSITGDDALLATLQSSLEKTAVSEPELTQRAPYWLQKAWHAQATHQFDTANQYLDKALSIQPRLGQAWLMKSAIATLQNQTEAAQQACNQVTQTLSITAGLVCKARLAKTLAAQEKALALLQNLLQQTHTNELHAWILNSAADLAVQLQQPKLAEDYYQQAIRINPTIQTRAAYADVLLQQKRYAAALQQTGNSTAPALAIRALIATKRISPDLPAAQKSLLQSTEQQIAEWYQAGDYQHAREMAMFYLDVVDNPQRAFELATTNLQNQQEREDAILLERAKRRLLELSSTSLQHQKARKEIMLPQKNQSHNEEIL